MAQNEEIALSLQPQPVPVDQECLGNLNGTSLLAFIAQYLAIAGSGGTQPGQVFPSAVVIATRAEAKADDALLQLKNLRLPQIRQPTQEIDLATGDSVVSLSWAPDMPSNDYTILYEFRRSTAPGANITAVTLSGTQAPGGAQVAINGAPANTKLFYTVMQNIGNPSTT